MFKYLIGFVLFSPLIGIYLMEQGAYGLDIGMSGYNNGAFNAYFLYVALVIISFLIFKNINILRIQPNLGVSTKPVISPYIVFAVVNFIFLLIMLFGFGGINVLFGTVGKGEFRTNLGFLGALPFYITRYFSPVLLAYLSFDFKKTEPNKIKTWFYSINIILIIFIGLTWGFKSTSLFMLIPAVIVYYWKVKWYKVILIALISITFLISTAVLFDQSKVSLSEFSIDQPSPDNAIAAIFYRITVMQGNTAWYVWDLHAQGIELPAYSPTLLAAFGDKFLNLFAGVSLNNINEFAKYHFDVLLTSLATGSFDSRIEGHNITGTAFVDGVFIGGIYGVVFISVLAGFVIGQCYNVISRAIIYNKPLIGSLTIVYFFGYVFTWLNGGGVTILFHISTVLGLAFTWLYLRYISKIRLTATKLYFPLFDSI